MRSQHKYILVQNFLLLTPQEVTKKEGAPMSRPAASLARKQFLAVVDTQPPVADQLK